MKGMGLGYGGQDQSSRIRKSIAFLRIFLANLVEGWLRLS